MARNFAIAIDLSHLIPVNAKLTDDVFPHLAHAVRVIAAQAHEDWVAYALGRPLPDGQIIRDRAGQYARSIVLHDTGPFSAEVKSDLAWATDIEQGTPERDMKKVLDTSFKVRRTKAGKRYLIIPFRHNVDTLPSGVVEFFKAGAASSVRSTYERQSGQIASVIGTRRAAKMQGFGGNLANDNGRRVMVPGWRYAWGSKLGKAALASLPGMGPHASKLAGMYHFNNPGGAAGGGARAGSNGQYITFRTMVEGSSGWIAKAVPGKYPARTVADSLRPTAEQAFAAAMQADVESMIGGGTP